MDQLAQLSFQIIQILVGLFIIVSGVVIVTLAVLYFKDRTQTKSTLKRNYPLLARFRYLFEHLGEFFRQYFFAGDREELPFNRAERSWVYRAAKNVDSTVAFGSSRDVRVPGTVYFVNCPFPTLDVDAAKPAVVKIGPYCRHPYKTDSLFNISGMSYGALSIPAIRALSNGARMAGIWMNTGEGGLSPYHLEGGADIVFQIGTAKFGVRNESGGFDEAKLKAVAEHEQVKMFEIKLSQGAKPGKGGILPGAKVNAEIAQIRGIKIGEDAISPNRHPEVNSVDDLLDMIDYVREVTGKPVGFKMVVGAYGWIENMCEAIHERGIQGAPWRLAEIAHGLGFAPAPTIPEGERFLAMVADHYQSALAFYGDDLGARVIRKHLGWYMERAGTPGPLRRQVLTGAPSEVMALLPGALVPAFARDAA